MSKKLSAEMNCVHPTQLVPQGLSVKYGVNIEENDLRVDFGVQSASPPFVRKELLFDQSQWGLWEADVVECFVDLGQGHYYEFILSPLGQFFELKIDEPRVRFDRSFKSGFRHAVRSFDSGAWSATMWIPIRQLGWQGELGVIRGGLFAILGAEPNRTYWSSFLPPQEKPDFHLPQHFKPLL